MSLSDDEKSLVDLQLKIWERTVQTQMHFNEMCVKSRQFGLAFVAAALGIGIVLLSQGKGFSIHFLDWSVHVSPLIVIGAAIGLWAVRQLDLNVYHKMLRGAVTFGMDFEENVLKPRVVPLEMGMTQAISHFSRYSDAAVSNSAESHKYHYEGKCKVNAEKKIKRFYLIAFWSLIFVAAVLSVATIERLPTRSPSDTAISSGSLPSQPLQSAPSE